MPDYRSLVLVVDDDELVREVLNARISDWGYRVATAATAAEAEAVAAERDPEIVIADVVLPDASGIELLRRLKEGRRDRPVLLITAHANVEMAVEAMKAGATDFLEKPLDTDKLRTLVDAAREDLRQRDRIRELEDRLDAKPGFGHLLGASPAMEEVFDAIRLLSENKASAIITGESGTGKELVARSIHSLGRRSRGPFVALNCAAIPEGLIESELFGHVEGAFTGARRDREGCFEAADGGILFLDEIAEMPASLQPKLLRILEEGRVRRVGGEREVAFDVRVLAATNRDPARAMEEGDLREDLYYRLAVFEVRLPPLRDRPEDIPLLAHHFALGANERHGTSVEGLRDEALELLAAYDWPGNVRELRNVVERSAIVAGSGFVDPSHLPPYLREGEGRPERVVVPVGTPVREAEKELILKTLEAVDHNRTEAARRLGVDVKTVYNKLKRYEEEDGRAGAGGSDGDGAEASGSEG